MSTSTEVEKNTYTSQIASEGLRYLGSVKWFNTKSGYGFITLLDGELAATDIFAHHSVISVKNEQYKYLIQGEYVSVLVQPSDATNYKWQATHVTGVCDGPLMCETRNAIKNQRVEYSQTRESAGGDYTQPKE